MFTTPRNNVIESDEGFSVEVLGRTGLKYVEGDRTLKIDSEVLSPPSGMAVFTASIRTWEPPHAGEAVDSAAKARVIDNVRRAFKHRGFSIQVF
jgi:hypothetical protein